MIKQKSIVNEREFIVPLRRQILKVQRHKRTPKAIKALKQFIAKHMKVPNRDLKKIKLDGFLNEELWYRGIKNPPTKIKVNAKRDGENIRVTLVNLPEKNKFKLIREEKKKKDLESSKKKDKKDVKKTEKKEELEKVGEQTIEEKKEELEKKESSTELKQEEAKAQQKAQKHVTKVDKNKSSPKRKSVKR